MTPLIRTPEDYAADIRQNIQAINSSSSPSEACDALKEERRLWTEIDDLGITEAVRLLLKQEGK